jgi:hypothetical protein
VPERGLRELVKVPVGAGNDAFSEVMTPLETVERGVYGAGAVTDGRFSVAGNDVESDLVPDLGLCELVNSAPSVLVAPEVSPLAPEP